MTGSAPAVKQAQLPYTIDYSNLTAPDNALLQKAAAYADEFATNPPPYLSGIYRSMAGQEDIDTIRQIVDSWKGYRHLVVVGAGGSGLSSQTLGVLSEGTRTALGKRNIHLLENLDITGQKKLFANLALEETAFLLVSKSGGTVETLAHAHFIREALRETGLTDMKQCFVALTMAGDNPLRSFAQECQCRIIDHDPNLGGRFSVLSAAGLIPALFLGLDIGELRRGASETCRALMDKQAPAFHMLTTGACAQIESIKKGRNLSILMPYSERLWGLARWWRQSWAESIGKNGTGSTPLIALGTTDQHSQLQLFLDGPDDKFYSFIHVHCEKEGTRLPQIDGTLAYLSGRTLGELMCAQQKATADTLREKGRPMRVFILDSVNEYTFGALYAYLVLEIIFTGYLLGVDPFNQPAVEQSKQLARQHLQRQD